ncbi:MAG: tRNA (adenosine(37)-N6)-threonylcarbamoyltransferase complex ATPase subunit type 1 TsaE [Bacteroidota bacterium]
MVNSDLPQKTLVCHQLEDLGECAREIISFGDNIDVWLFEGEMGAGKTTLIKKICELYGVVDNVSSPTFSIVNEYQNSEEDTFYHFDFYRIEYESEAINIGIEDYFYSGYHCFVEWPSKIKNLFPEKFLKVDIAVNDEEVRSIELIRYD